jgi:hypothetical protein
MKDIKVISQIPQFLRIEIINLDGELLQYTNIIYRH